MQTIQLEYQVDNHIYEEFLKNGSKIKDKVREFLIFELNMMDDGYPTIGTAEAKRRVAEAVEHYKRSPEDFVPYDDGYWDDLDAKIDAFKVR